MMRAHPAFNPVSRRAQNETIAFEKQQPIREESIRLRAALLDKIGHPDLNGRFDRKNYSATPVPRDMIFLLAFRQHCSEY
jgi:hypothetical protein